MKRFVPILMALLILASCAAEKTALEETAPAAVSGSAVPAAAKDAQESASPTEVPYAGDLIAETAKGFIGYKYVYGGESPDDGFDCSGLVYYVFREHGYRLHRVADDQSREGDKVESTDDLLPGDLVCFKKGSYCGHIGIYLGDGQFIHAMDKANGVVVTPLSDYIQRYNVEGRRIVGVLEVKTREQIEQEEAWERELLEEEMRNRPSPTPFPTPEKDSKPTADPDSIYILPTPTPASTPVPTPTPNSTPEPTQEPPADPSPSADSSQDSGTDDSGSP